ncbi:MAG: Lysyl oxidase, partial [Solirubrobacterales bacterium]|nr:Lysyl oxidase [Solirubrobacterales bacterium]
EPNIGPKEAVYSDATGRKFCRQHEPTALSLFEGVSVGWRDLYSSNLAFQWVDASSVLPGEYWLREDVNPTGVIKEVSENAPGYANNATIIKGFNARAQSVTTAAGEARTVTLTSKSWSDSATPKYKILTQPAHGTLGSLSGSHQETVTYTPDQYYYGPDSFTFSASDPNSPFPRSPAAATVSVEVGAGQSPSVAVEGAPATMIAGTSIQLSALVTNDRPGVTWSATGGSISPTGQFTAPAEPPAGGTVTVTAHSARGAEGNATINILPVPAAEPLPVASLPPSSGAGSTEPGSGSSTPAPGAGPTVSTLGASSALPPPVYRPEAMLVGRRLIMTTKVSRAGRIRLAAYLGHRRLGTCAVQTPADRSFTCRLTLEKSIRLNARISILASLRIGSTVIDVVRPAAPVPRMKMTGATPLHARAAGLATSQFWCSPSMVESP